MTAGNQHDDTTTPDWLDIARRVVESCGLAGAQVDWLAHTHNAVFSVHHGRRDYVLLLHTHSADRARVASELRWLARIREHAGPVAPLAAAASTDPFAPAVEMGDTPVDYVLFERLDGQPRPPESITPDDMGAIGGFLARLHAVPPLEDGTFTRLDWEGLFGADSPYSSPEAVRLFDDAQRAVMAKVAERVRAVMEALEQRADTFGLIHGDLLSKNILFDGETVRALDFEYCGWGYYLYDLAPLLWEMKPRPDYGELEAALWAGYTAGRPQPAGCHEAVEVFVAARHVASCRWIAANADHPYVAGRADAIIAVRIGELQRFLDTGRLERNKR